MIVKEILKKTEVNMKETTEHLNHEFAVIRTGKATPSILDNVRVSYYNTPTPVQHLANITTPDAGLIVVKPWDKSIIDEIKNAILKEDLGLVPSVEGEVIKIPIPPLSDERRQELTKLVHKVAEEARVSIRNRRRDAKEEIEKKEKAGEISEDDSTRAHKELEQLTSDFVDEINKHLERKEKEIKEV